MTRSITFDAGLEFSPRAGVKVEHGIILAAGLSRRFGRENKLLSSLAGRPIASYVIDAARASDLKSIILVTGQDGDSIAALAGGDKFVRVHNPNFTDGLSSSLQAGLRAAPADAPVLVLLADMPLISPALINDVCAAWRPDAYALAPIFEGQAGNPVILSPAARADALQLTGDRGAKILFDGRTDIIWHPVADAAVLRDVDDIADIAVAAGHI